MTFRAVNTLRDVDLILAEDTRHTQKLLNHFEIETPQKSFHEHNTQERIPQVIEWMQEGKTIAQVERRWYTFDQWPRFWTRTSLRRSRYSCDSSSRGRMRELRLLLQVALFLSLLFLWILTKKKEKIWSSSNYARIARLSFYTNHLSIERYVFGDSNCLRRTTICRFMPWVDEDLRRVYSRNSRRTRSSCKREELKGECCILIGHKNPDKVTTALSGALEENTPDASFIYRRTSRLVYGTSKSYAKDAIKAVIKTSGP